MIAMTSACSAGDSGGSPVRILEAAPRGSSTVALALAICNQPFRITTEESSKQVVITVMRSEPEPADREDCASGAEVELEEPLADRTIIDGSSGQPAPSPEE